MNKKDAFVIFSVFQSRLSHQDNMDNHKKVLRHLKDFGLRFKVVEGVYRGESELSIFIDCKLVSILSRSFDIVKAGVVEYFIPCFL